MTGNVWEWCSDWYSSNYYKTSPPSNPQGPDKGVSRILRGGSWNNYPSEIYITNRGNISGNNKKNDIGFRLVSTP